MVDDAVLASEHATGDRNGAIAWLMHAAGALPVDVDDALSVYFRQCSVRVTCWTETATACGPSVPSAGCPRGSACTSSPSSVHRPGRAPLGPRRRPALQAGPLRHLVLDLHRITHTSTAAVDLLHRLVRRLAEDGVRLVWSATGPLVTAPDLLHRAALVDDRVA